MQLWTHFLTEVLVVEVVAAVVVGSPSSSGSQARHFCRSADDKSRAGSKTLSVIFKGKATAGREMNI